MRDEENDGDEWKLKPLREASAPLKKLAEDIVKTAHAISETIEDEDPMLSHYKLMMMQDAFTLPVKISGAMATLDYTLMMENAVVIKLAARSLMTICTGLDMKGYEDTSYLKALRDDLETFKKLFAKWVRCFPREEPIWPDGWALFYTPEDIEIWNRMNPTEQVEE